METEKINEKEEKILSTKEALIYGLPNLGLYSVFSVCISFTLIFYINILGQPPIIAGGLYSIALYIYAFVCLFGGALSDKIGKQKVLLVSIPIVAIAFILMWFPPIPSTTFGEPFIPLVIWLAIFILTFRIFVGFFQPTLYSYLPEISTEQQNRIKTSMINMMMTILGTVIGVIIPIILMGENTENLSRDDPDLFYPNSIEGRTIFAQIQILTVILGISFIILGFFMIWRIKIPEKNQKSNNSKVKILDNLKNPIKDRNFRLFLIAFFLFWIPFVAFQYLIIPMGTFLIQLRGSEFYIMGGVSLSFAAISFIIWKKISKRFGLKKTMMICLIYAAFSFSLVLILLVPMPHEVIFGIGLILLSLCLSSLVGTMIFPFAIMAELIDAEEQKTGKNLSGSYSGAFTMTGSLASGTAMGIISIFLEIFGSEAGISYGFILTLGALFIIISILIFKKIELKNKE
ncbi:MAG: MFS transporter [Promethearchaeota archaeon]